jgi:hypothetical protein
MVVASIDIFSPAALQIQRPVLNLYVALPCMYII